MYTPSAPGNPQISRDNFPADAAKLLAGAPKLAEGVYGLSVSNQNYIPFLDFLVSELSSLPFDGQVGKPILMRPNAKATVEGIVSYLTGQKQRLISGQDWNTNFSGIESLFRPPLEIFKNEIYPGMNTNGICYSVDLGVGTGFKPLRIALRRYFADAGKGTHDGLSVKHVGSILLHIPDGEMAIELSNRPVNLHRGKP